jgi:hypothetical protein
VIGKVRCEQDAVYEHECPAVARRGARREELEHRVAGVRRLAGQIAADRDLRQWPAGKANVLRRGDRKRVCRRDCEKKDRRNTEHQSQSASDGPALDKEKGSTDRAPPNNADWGEHALYLSNPSK